MSQNRKLMARAYLPECDVPTTKDWARRNLLFGLAAISFASTVVAQQSRSPAIQVWKDPNCGCCKDWIDHLEKAGFTATISDQGNNAIRSKLGLPQKFGSCHTALVQGYVIEGHVPASDILKLLKIRPNALGLAVPGMPIGSPGMDGSVYGNRRDAFDVLLVQRDGTSKVFTSYRENQGANPRHELHVSS
jgi:hypothetical protein